MDTEVCFDRYSRYGPYGYGEDDNGVQGWIRPKKVDWDNVDWGTLQADCVDKNAERFGLPRSDRSSPPQPGDAPPPAVEPRAGAGSEKRTAFLLRSWTGKVYSENDKQNIRSMVTELSLMSGGEYEVVLLVHCKDDNLPIWEDDVYQAVLDEHVPREFWNITELWNMGMVRGQFPNFDDSFFKYGKQQHLFNS